MIQQQLLTKMQHTTVYRLVNENLSVSAGRQSVDIDSAVDNEINSGVSASYTMGSSQLVQL